MKELFWTPCSIASLLPYLQNASQVFYRMILASHNSFQLHTIYIYKSFDCNPSVNVRGTFLCISKAFDKVQHDSLIYKLKSHGIGNKLLNLIQNCLTNRQQHVLLNGWTSKWTNILAGVPQGSALSPFFFKFI